MDLETLWNHIHDERESLAVTLGELSSEQWQVESLCPGWTVKDVAAHVISNPQIGWSAMPGMALRNLGRGYNSMIFREVRRLGRTRSCEQILTDYATYADSRRHVPVTTNVEPLIDALVHHQDVVRPLGRAHEMDPGAASVAADRVRRLAFLMGSRDVVRRVRMEATDVDWVRGTGPTLRGPMQELLMVCAGRARVAADLAGDGLALLA
ncbi:maleylpyruvate isomerase family mycothiol-dependent enzyme [Nocardioides jensenii]|uniref:maleylpyruvate isomerase family mycothiol-dependent enzyme n=1 Tax=Nocardioides jensenii TaxID=1843 RepID=UPI00082E117F|nr:maleylpyruvate isomerase family mycothiol-dependent enzyme [Nocardioides jensenii]